MDDASVLKIRAAVSAAWWTLLFGAAFFALQWIGYRVVMSARPAWVLSAWGPDATWEGIQTTWFAGLVFLKLTLWPLALLAVWLTLWARYLRADRRTP